VNLGDIRKLNPCYDPNRYLPENWQGTVADILRLEACPEKDRIWVAVRLIDDKTARLFAVWCAREALARVSNPDPRSIAACDVTERYAHGQATTEELAVAEREARAAAREAWEVARAAAWPAWEVARVAAEAADAAWTAARAAVDIFHVTEQKNQIEKLLEIAEGRNEK
jgi:hypothetical protein